METAIVRLVFFFFLLSIQRLVNINPVSCRTLKGKKKKWENLVKPRNYRLNRENIAWNRVELSLIELNEVKWSKIE